MRQVNPLGRRAQPRAPDFKYYRMLRPLEEFICDECGQVIASPHDGYVEWEEGQDENGVHFARGFRIVHHTPRSPLKTIDGCYSYGDSRYRNDISLEYFIENVHQYLASFLDLGLMHDANHRIGCRISNFRQFTDFAKRLTIPYYEEARLYIPTAIQDGFCSDCNELALYTPDYLRRIIERYAQ